MRQRAWCLVFAAIVSTSFANDSVDIPDCVENDECDLDRVCTNNRCVNPCLGICGPHTVCQVINHVAMCSCIPGYSGHPTIGCVPPESDEDDSTECSSHDQCPANSSCIRGFCEDPCVGLCGPNSICKVTYHIPSCACLENYLGNPFVGCRPQTSTECKFNKDCPAEKACIKKRCDDPCRRNYCGRNEVCQVRDHKPTCKCKPGCTGTPKLGCEPDTDDNECKTDRDCPAEKACIDNSCEDPCEGNDCGCNEVCQVCDHEPICKSKPGYKKTPLSGCEPDTDEDECRNDRDCPSEKACIDNSCEDPCEGNPCGDNEVCLVSDHEPTCKCKPGYKGTPLLGCEPDDSCSSKSDCPDHLTCQRRECIDPCKWCGDNTDCEVKNHTATCTCKPGYEGEPDAGCTKIEEGCLECKGNDHCHANNSCIRGKCKDPCEKHCGKNALCQVIKHLPICVCKDGYAGNPMTGCKEQDCSGKWPPAPRGKKKFYIEHASAFWDEAYVSCLRNRSRLATMDSKAEHLEILALIRSTGLKSGQFWTGGTDLGYEGHYIWAATGEPINSDVPEYHFGQPDNFFGVEHCIEFWEVGLSLGYLWNDRNCHEKHYYICEYYD